MTRLQILDELGEELERVARELDQPRFRRSAGRRALAALPVALAAAVAVLVVLLAISSIGSRAHRPAGAVVAHVRGEVVDRNGGVLARTLSKTLIGFRARRVPTDEALRLRAVLLNRHLSSASAASYIAHHRAEFPDVALWPQSFRYFPKGGLAAQLLGTLGPIEAAQRRDLQFDGIAANTLVGQSGLEFEYDQYLRAGDTLKLALDPGLQEAGLAALQRAIARNRPANGGAYVALDPATGAVYAMGSLPTFDPNVFRRPASPAAISLLAGPTSPLLNRATQFAGPPGSTFKPLTALAALESGAWNIHGTYDDTGQYCIASQCRRNPGGAADGVLSMVDALRVGSSVFFYNLGALTNNPAPQGGALQRWTTALGVGRPTAIDLTGESGGTLPTPAWRAQLNRVEAACERARHLASCGIADGRPWSIGDNINLAVGQGDIQVSPLQLAVAYAAIANGGIVLRPHLGEEVLRPSGSVLEQIGPSPVRHLNVSPSSLETVRQGLRQAAARPGGTTADVFGNFPAQVYGESGTAQYNGQQDYAWYAGFVPASATSKPIVVVVMVQQGGFGAHTAAPVARQLLSQWFLGRPGPWVTGASRTL